MARPPIIETDAAFRVVLNMQSIGLTDDQFIQLCSENRDFRFEMSAKKELIIMPPPGAKTGQRNGVITMYLGIWTKQDGTGVFFGCDAGFTLPDGAKRGPDAAWMSLDLWNSVTEEQREKLPTLCPEFIVELRSPSNRLADIQEKMQEYIANGAQLGWLLDPLENCAIIYRPGQAPERIDKPAIISADPILRGFKFDFREIL